MTLPRHIHESLREILDDLGLSANETRVFFYLFESTTAERTSAIARRTKLNRTTLYGILKSLCEKGLVSSVEDRGVLTYRAIEPSFLIDSIQRQKAKLSSDAEKVKEFMPQIEQSRKGPGRKFPTIQFFDGIEGIEQAYEDTITNNPSRVVYGFTGANALYKVMKLDWIKYYLERRSKAGILWHAIAANSDQSRKMQLQDKAESRITKMLPTDYKFDIEIGAYENKVLITSFAEDHPLAIIIEDEKIAQTIKVLFRYIDSTLKE